MTNDRNGRPLEGYYPPAPDFQPILEAKAAALAERLALIEQQQQDAGPQAAAPAPAKAGKAAKAG